MQYLKNSDYYSDRYDLHTIKECLEHYWGVKDKSLEEKDKSEYFRKYTPEKFDREITKCLNIMLYTLKGERYRNKSKTIQEWMDRDRKEQEKYDNANPPAGIHCKECGSPTEVSDKDLLDAYEENAQVLFMFKCTKCNKNQAFYEDGSEWMYEPPKCPDCNGELESEHKDVDEVMTTTYSCTKCSYKKEDTYDFKKSREEREKREAKERKLLAECREEFCLNDKDGQEYIEMMEAMDVASVIKEEERQKYERSVYERSLQLKKITITDLEKLLSAPLEKAKYTKLSFEKPEIGQYVIVPFTLQDGGSSRKSKVSTSDLEMIIKNTLEDTNWRLLSNSIMYRLGYLEGRLKGYEQEEDMLKLAGKKEEIKAIPKIDEEKKQKYAHHNVVQLARLSGEFEGIEKMRKRRLEKEPEGFFLELSEGGPYTCGICYQSIPGDETWWTPEGLRCIDCQRNYKEGNIPPEFYEEDYGYDVFIKKWDLQSDYGVHPSCIRKLRKEGILKGRDLKRKDGSVYFTFYLVRENNEFLKKYPRKKTELDKQL